MSTKFGSPSEKRVEDENLSKNHYGNYLNIKTRDKNDEVESTISIGLLDSDSDSDVQFVQLLAATYFIIIYKYVNNL